MMTEKNTMERVTDTEKPAEDTSPAAPDHQDTSPQAATTPSQISGSAPEDPAAESTATLIELEEKLVGAERLAQENYDRFLRTAAELDNFRKRKEREVEDLRKYANQTLLRDLLGVVDNLERALAASRENDTPEGLTEGVEMTLKELLKIFDQFGVKAIASLEQPFDPNLHDAVMQEASESVAANTVIKELQKGYLLRDRLLRPAMVVVSK